MNIRPQKTQICNRLQRSGKSFLSVMLSLIMILSGMYTGVPEMMVTAYANSTGGVYTEYIPTEYKQDNIYLTEEETYEKLVTFNGMQWYIIEDNSTSFNSGTVTLLVKDYVGISEFGNTTEYASSTIKGFLTDYYSDHFSGVDSAILNHDGLGKLYLLSGEEADNITNSYVMKCADYEHYISPEELSGWWLRGPGYAEEERVALVSHYSVRVDYNGDYYLKEFCVRPALELNLEEVTFLPETMTFVLNSQVSHTHYYSYAANDNTITATCSRSGCTLPNQKATLTITANGGTYDGATAFGATVSDLNHIKGDAVIKYYHCNADGTRGTALEPVTTAPKDAGKYWAEITVGTATAHISYTIAKADPNVTAPRAEATYGQKLSDITLINPEGNIEGSWTFVDPLSTSVGDAGEHTFKANFIPANTNYNELANVDVTITVNEANQSVTAPQAEATYGQTLGDITLVNPQNNIEGNWTWVDSSTSVGNVGEHKFKATFTPADTNYSVVSNVDITVIVNQAEPNVTAPQAEATYGQTLGNIALSNPQGNIEGNWTWVDSSTSVGNVGQQFFKAIFTPEDTTNYKSVNNVNVKVIVGKGNNPTTVENSAVVKKGGSTIDLANNVRLYDAAGAVGYQISGETCGCTLAGSVLTTGDVTGSVTVKVTVAEDEHYIALNEAFISVSVTEKLIQTISASDVTATYGDTDKSIHATVSGNGALSYAVKDGSEDLIGVDASNGALTTKKVGTATVLVMAEETEDYALAVKEVSVTILPADSVVTKAPTANSLIYTGIAQQLVTEGEATGGSMQYALGTRTEVTGIFSDTPPSVTKAGTYYVWYRVNGDVNHNDTDINEAVMVNISRKTVTVTGITAENKVYDGNNAATLVTTTADFDGMVEGDDLTVTATGTFDTADAGENKTVTISNLALGGTSVNNYTIAQGNDPITVNAAIIAKEVGLTWTNTDLTYTGSAQKPVATATGLVGEDTCTVTVTGEQTNAGNYTATASSLSNGNYSLPIDATTSFGIGKADSSVETDPTAKSLKYNGQAQALVTGGTATGGTMIYAVTTENTVPTSESFNDGSIPAAMNAGTYYVWYKVVGDENHNGISPTFVKVEVAKASGTATVGKTATAYINGKPLDLSVYVKDAVGEVTYVIKEALDGCSVDANTGMFTQGISQGKCVVEVSIAESNNYMAQTEEIEVSVVSKSQDMLEVILEDIEYGAVLSQPVYYIAGTEETPTGGTVQITYSGKLKKDDSDYSSETAPTEAGDYDVQVLYETDTMLYAGDAHFQIKPFDIRDAEVTLSASELTYTGSEQTVRVTEVTLGGQELSSAEYSVFGNQATDADDYTLTVSAIDAGNYTGSITKAFVIKKATPYVKTNPTAESIIYGQCLADSALSNGEAQISESIETLVPGSFAWRDTQMMPPITDGNMSEYAVIFTPEDTKNLESVTVYVSLEVAKIKCAPNCPESTMEVGYGVKKANEIVLPEGWVISDADQETELVAGKAVTVTAVYDKVDKENYETNSIKISVTRKGFSYADLIPTGGDGDQEAVNDKMVTFNGMQWYIIEDNSTSTNSGTVTLLAKDHVGTSVFGETAEYSGSTIQSFLADYYRDHFSGMDDAVVDEGLGRLYLLSVEEAKAITNNLVRKCADYDGSDSELEFWWLRSKSNVSDEWAAIVHNRDNYNYRIDESGNWIGIVYCVRPALKLDLAAVTISPETKTFTLKNQDTQNNTNTVSGNTGKKEDGQEVSGDKDSTVTPDISDKPDATKEQKPDTTQKQDVTKRQDPITSEKQDTTKEQNTTGKAQAKGTKFSTSDSKAVYVVTSLEGQEPAVEYRPATGFKDKTIKIPESVTEDGVTYKVTSIAKKAFKGNKKIQSVVIPASVTQVGNNAFEGCKNLKTVVIGKRIKKLGANLFKGCGKLKTVTIKSTGLSADNVNKKAFTGVGNEVIFKVPKKRKKVYTAMFRKKGLPKKVKIK